MVEATDTVGDNTVFSFDTGDRKPHCVFAVFDAEHDRFCIEVIPVSRAPFALAAHSIEIELLATDVPFVRLHIVYFTWGVAGFRVGSSDRVECAPIGMIGGKLLPGDDRSREWQKSRPLQLTSELAFSRIAGRTPLGVCIRLPIPNSSASKSNWIVSELTQTTTVNSKHRVERLSTGSATSVSPAIDWSSDISLI